MVSLSSRCHTPTAAPRSSGSSRPRSVRATSTSFGRIMPSPIPVPSVIMPSICMSTKSSSGRLAPAEWRVMQLRMRLHDVVTLEERLHRELPVGRKHGRLPPGGPHLPDVDRVEQLRAATRTTRAAAARRGPCSRTRTRPRCRPGTRRDGGRRDRVPPRENNSGWYTKELEPSRFQHQPWNGQMKPPPSQLPRSSTSFVARWRQALKYALIVSASTRTTMIDWSRIRYSTKSPGSGISSSRHAICHTCGQRCWRSSSKNSGE